jgi:sulfur oxidation c-type cytochrome SoxX
LSHADKRDAIRPTKATLRGPLNGNPKRGKEIAMSKSDRNCATCHQLPGDEWPGTVGNSLLHYKTRGYTDDRVYQQLYDARKFNPNSIMPPFGSHNLLSDQDLRDIVAYLQSIE